MLLSERVLRTLKSPSTSVDTDLFPLLIKEGALVKSRNCVRLPLVSELLNKAQKDVLAGKQGIRLILDDVYAGALERGLELYSRLQSGQWHEILHLFNLNLDQKDQLEEVLNGAKTSLMGLRTHASRGDIYGLSWELYQLVRHRRAWDSLPQGSNCGIWNVSYDEPLIAHLPRALVLSFSDNGNRLTCIDIAEENYKQVVKIMCFVRAIKRGKISLLLDFVPDETPNLQDYSFYKNALESWEREFASNITPEESTERLFSVLESKKNIEGCLVGIINKGIDRGRPINTTGLYFQHWYSYNKGIWKVIAERDNAAIAIAQSHSLQTAIAKAAIHYGRMVSCQ